MNNFAFSKAVRLLAHPLSLAAIGLMLANDFLFKSLWPSWWTGKLSDFAGLFFLPFLLAVLLSPLSQNPRRVGWLAFGLVGVGFTLLKIDPAFNSLLIVLGRTVAGLPLQARLDPTDLLALLSLLPAAWLWRKQPARPLPAPPALHWDWRLLALPLAALVTLADAAAPDYGIACLTVSNSQIVATSGYLSGSYLSSDSGLTWQADTSGSRPECRPDIGSEITLKDPATETVYQVKPGVGVKRSSDGGATWISDYSFTTASEPEKTYVLMTRSGNISFGSTPYAAILDPASGNLVMAMGQDGVLVRRSAGQWTWVTVGPYRHEALRQAGLGGILFLVQYQIGLAFLVAFGWLYTRAARRMPGRTTVWVVLGWVALALLSLLLSPEVVTSSYLAVGVFLALLFMAAATLIALLTAVFRLKGEFFRIFAAALPQMLLLALACLLPYLLWATGFLPQFGYALLASTVLVAILFVVFYPKSRPEPSTAVDPAG